MADIKITDLVDPDEIRKLKELDEEFKTLLATYAGVAREMARGLQVDVKVVGDIDKLEKLLVEKGKEAVQVQQRLTQVMNERSQVIANTNNTASRRLMELERENKATRATYTEQEKVKRLLDEYHDTYENQIKSMVRINNQLEANKKQHKDNERALKMGRMSTEDYAKAQVELMASTRELTQQKRTLNQIMTAEEKANQAGEESYVRLSQQLELLKKAYKDMGEESKASDFGREMESAIQNLDAHLKDMAADMGEFQRSVGNYAIAGQQGVVTTDSVIAAISQEARTTQDLIDQTKILEEAKLLLNKEDSNYQATLDAMNAKIEENKRKLMDVSDILGKEARTVAEAEAQNKRLSEAMKHIDLTSSDAKQKLAEMRAQIQRNNETIAQATGANEKFADSMLALIGVNGNFGKSVMGLQTSGNFLDGLQTKTKAFGQTLFGLISNPWVLAFLGIAGVVAGFKWWYDYNKGMIEATKLTKNFTGATGEAADKVTADMQTLADHMDKGYDETIGAANVLVQQFGVSWEEARELMEKGLMAGADMSGNMVNMINQFGPALRDAGVDAEQFIAILSNTRNGIFDEKGVSDILKGGTRLRAMTKQIADSLDACGISSKKMQKDLEDGNITMLQAVQQVSEKLKELPENSQEAGMVMKNVFGRTAAEGGTLLIQSLADIDTNLESCIKSMGEMGELTGAQIKAERELHETIAAVFKMSGTSFEEMIGYAKVYVTQWLTQLIKKCVDIYNWFARIYNESIAFRKIIGTIIAVLRTLWTVIRTNFELVFNGFKALGGAFEGLMMILSGDIEAGFNKIKENVMNGIKGIINGFKGAGTEIGKNFTEELDKATNNRMVEINYTLKPDSTTGKGSDRNKDDKNKDDKNKDDKNSQSKGSGNAERRKQAQEELKLIKELEAVKIAVMADGHEKELAMIRLKFKEKIDAIKGDSETETALRVQLAEQCQQEINACEQKYQEELAKINLANQLAIVKEGSAEELALKLQQLEKERKAELKTAEKTGADVLLINKKYYKKKEEAEEEHAAKMLEIIQKKYADQQEEQDTAMILELNALKTQYAKELSAAKGNMDKQERIKEKFERDSADIAQRYAMQAAQSSIDMIEEQLKTEDLSAEERANLERKLAKEKAKLEQQMADDAIENIERINQEDEDSTGRRIGNAQKWLQVAADSLNEINALIGAVYDAKISKVEEEQEVNTEAAESEQERIVRLVEQKVITEEEGEARKRAAEARTAKKNEELAKKTAKLKERQAKFDKLNSIAQVGIATALSLMQLWVKPGWPAAIPMMAVVSALGALQLATILATPLPKYAKGTDYHKGGPAIVGDGGVPEIISFGGNSWITPDTPTLVDIPAGATVMPDISTLGLSELFAVRPLPQEGKDAPKPYNDTKVLDRLDSLIYMKRCEARARRQADIDAQLARYLIDKNI